MILHFFDYIIEILMDWVYYVFLFLIILFVDFVGPLRLIGWGLSVLNFYTVLLYCAYAFQDML